MRTTPPTCHSRSLKDKDQAYLEETGLETSWCSIKKISCDLQLDNVLAKHQSVFKDELGTTQGVMAKLFVKPDSMPIFFKPRPVPHALKGAFEQELDRLEGMGVIEKVRYSEWAAPIVPVVKPDNLIRYVDIIKSPSIPFWKLTSTLCQTSKNCSLL